MQSSKALADVKRGAKCHRFSSFLQLKIIEKRVFFSQITNGHFFDWNFRSKKIAESDQLVS